MNKRSKKGMPIEGRESLEKMKNSVRLLDTIHMECCRRVKTLGY